MTSNYISLTVAALLPAIMSVLIYFLEKKTSFGKLNYKVKQLIIGIVFGAIAILGTEWGIPINGAQVNCRDAAVLTAGLVFGGPAGIIAGLIGGIERWFAIYWGVGEFTRAACTISTILAGFYAYAMRKFMFENKKPGWLLSFAIGVVMEVFHLTMVFVTNMNDPDGAFNVVKSCSVPLIVANGASVLLSAITISLLIRESSSKAKGSNIAQTIQRWLLVTVVLAFVVSTLFLYQLQTKIAEKQTEAMLTQAITEISQDITDASDEKLINITKLVANGISHTPLKELAQNFDVCEINIIDKNGIITDSTEKDYIGFNMIQENKNAQSTEFFNNLKNSKTGTYAQKLKAISKDSEKERKYAGIKTDSGYIQVGYDKANYHKDIDGLIPAMAKNRHIGTYENGSIIILNQQFDVISASEKFELTNVSKDVERTEKLKENVVFKTTVNGKESYCKYIKSEGYYIASILPVEDSNQSRNTIMLVNTFMEILIFAVLFVFVYLVIKKVVVNKIALINRSLSKIASGNLEETINVRSNTEFASLSDDINSTVDTLKQYIDEASARIDKELEFAKSIQKSALPGIFPAFPNKTEFDIFASMTPAKEVGGDFYDFYFVGENTLAFLIADVSGKGIPAAMFMMTAKALIKNLAETGIPVEEVFTRANEELCKMNDTGMFVTAWLGEIDLKTGMLSFVNAGHNPPLIKQGKNGFEYLKARSGLVLAGMDGIKYRRKEIQILPGDKIYLYTDGVTEATNSNTELFGEERLLETINNSQATDCNALCKEIKSKVDDFVGDAEQFDDITMLSLNLFELDGYNKLTLVPTIQSVERVTDFVDMWLSKTKVDSKINRKVKVAIDEIYSNIANYSGADWASVLYERDIDHICLTFTDNGKPYNPLEADEPDTTLSAEERQIGGLGIFMVKKIMDKLEYSYENEQNILKLTKNI